MYIEEEEEEEVFGSSSLFWGILQNPASTSQEFLSQYSIWYFSFAQIIRSLDLFLRIFQLQGPTDSATLPSGQRQTNVYNNRK